MLPDEWNSRPRCYAAKPPYARPDGFGLRALTIFHRVGNQRGLIGFHARSPSPNRRSRGTTPSGAIADAYTDQVWEFPEKALAIQWAIFPGLGTVTR